MVLNELMDYCRSHKSVYSYGAGNYGRVLRAYLREKGFELIGFLPDKFFASI